MHKTSQCDCCDVFFAGKYDHSFGTSRELIRTNVGLATRKMNRDEKKSIGDEIKLFNSQLKAEKAEENKMAAEEKRTLLEQKRVD